MNLDLTQKGHYKMLISDDVSMEMFCRVQFEPIVHSMQHHSDNRLAITMVFYLILSTCNYSLLHERAIVGKAHM